MSGCSCPKVCNADTGKRVKSFSERPVLRADRKGLSERLVDRPVPDSCSRPVAPSGRADSRADERPVERAEDLADSLTDSLQD
mmetsp:Transcript_11581/g.18906  ORF Transcript_11581/g.18906 Transcript_11581/m.18906 type:complete len:83 (+) Transcript_11581:472-720(+)